MDSITKPISIEEAYYIYVPNTFTPDGNRFNNYFTASVYGIRSINIQIFNRWGQLVFRSVGYAEKFNGTNNGKDLPVGTYYYVIEPESGRKPVTGYVTILK